MNKILAFALSVFLFIGISACSDSKKYQDRVARWPAEVESGGGTWSIINDLENLDQIFSN